MTLANTIHERILKLTFLLALSLSGLQLWQGLTSEIPSTYFRPMHLSWVLVLVFLRYPFIANQSSRYYTYGRSIDVFLAALCVWVGYNIIAFDYNQIDHMLYGLATQDFIAGSLIMVLLLEAARRSVGMVMAMIGLCFICYTLYGSGLPDAIANRGFSLERLIRYQVYTASGIFGPALGIAAGTVFIFVLFGAFLEVSGAGRYFIDLANAAVGKYRGGPAKASVIASAALGSISGSSIANTATSGVVTIPMMKKLGYKPEQAAGIEAAASTGGQIMPPIMGAGAFLIAKFTNTPYSDIVLMSIAPAILYFGCTLFYVHLMACKLGMKGEKNLSNTWRIFIFGAHFILPLAVITVLLLMNYSPELVGISGCLAIVVAAFFRRHTRLSIQKIIDGMVKGAVMALPISVACATAGIVVGAIGQTGIGLQFTEFVISLASGQLWLALILVALCALILGLGLPVTAAYIVIAVMAGPALASMGLSLIAAHMIIFWLSQSSNVTPPIALAAFTAAGIAGAKPMRSAIEAFKLSLGLFIIPLMMAYSNLLYVDSISLGSFTLSIFYTTILIVALAVSLEGYCFTIVAPLSRVLICLAGLSILIPDTTIRLSGAALLLLFLTINYSRRENPSIGVARS